MEDFHRKEGKNDGPIQAGLWLRAARMMTLDLNRLYGMGMTARDLIEIWTERLLAEQEQCLRAEVDQPITGVTGRLLQTVGMIYLYEFTLPSDRALPIDTPLSLVSQDENEPAEGIVLSCHRDILLVQTFDSMGQVVEDITLIPDRVGYLTTASGRLKEMLTRPDAYRLGPVDRLAPLLDPSARFEEIGGTAKSILTTIWSDDVTMRRQRIASLVMELIRANKRVLLVTPNYHAADQLAGTIARVMKAGGLNYKTWISRYELTLMQQSGGFGIQELGFEAQMHNFYAKSRADKAALRRKYERFRELTPLLAYKNQKQKDLNEVRLLEWRLLTQLSELQTKSKEANAILSEYEKLPLLRRLSMQAVGKNVDSLQQYLALYQGQITDLMKELDIAKSRIEELVPEAAVPKDMRPEFEELKEEIIRLGGTKKIRELLAAEEDTNRQAFIQNRRLLITTATRVLGDPLFSRVRFDVLISDNAPLTPVPALLGSAGLVRERIVLTGDTQDIASAGLWTSHEMAAKSGL